MISRLIILAVALVASFAAAPAARALVPCPTSEYSLTFEDGTANLTGMSEEAVGALVARSRVCPDVVIVLRSFGPDQELTYARAHTVHAAIMRQPGAAVVIETRIVRCATGAERVLAAVHFAYPGRPPIDASCPAGG